MYFFRLHLSFNENKSISSLCKICVNLRHPLVCAVVGRGCWSLSVCFGLSGTSDGYGSAREDGSSCSSRKWPGSPLTSRWKTTASWRSSACSSSTPTRWFTSASQRTTCTDTRRWRGLTRWALPTLPPSGPSAHASGGTWLVLSASLSVPPTGPHWPAQTLPGLAGHLGRATRDPQHGCRHPQVADGRRAGGPAVLHHHLRARGPPLSQR